MNYDLAALAREGASWGDAPEAADEHEQALLDAAHALIVERRAAREQRDHERIEAERQARLDVIADPMERWIATKLGLPPERGPDDDEWSPIVERIAGACGYPIDLTASDVSDELASALGTSATQRGGEL